MIHTECINCELSNGDCGNHFKMDGKTNYDIASLSACDKYGNCMFFKSKAKPKVERAERALAIIDRLRTDKYINNKEQGILRRAILLPERPQGDLISREALKEAIKEIFDTVEVVLFDDIIATIDNAPAVEYPFYQEAYQTGYEEGKNERPQGEKIKKKPYGWLYCSECYHLLEPQDNFCWFCGAEMQKGGAE